MNLSLFDGVYTVTNIFSTYIIFKMMHVFLGERRTSRMTEFLSYVFYFMVCTGIYLWFKTPMLMAVANLLLFFLLTLNYAASIRRRLVVMLEVYLILSCTEIIVLAFTGYINFPVWETVDFDSIYSVVVIKVISYLVMLVLEKRKSNRQDVHLPFSYWFGIFMIPIASLLLLFILISSVSLSRASILGVVCLILLINFIVFYFYDRIVAVMLENARNKVFVLQSMYYEKQLELLQENMKNIQRLKHDMKNHLLVFRSLYTQNDQEGCQKYYEDWMRELEESEDIVRSGNLVVDSIMNDKFAVLKNLHVQLEWDVRIPEDIKLPPFVLTTILGNLMDNAIAGVQTIPAYRKCSVYLHSTKSMFMLEISNSFDGEIKQEKGKFFTSKKDRENHGIGMENVREVLNRYQGDLEIEFDDEWFTVIVYIYMDRI